MYNMDKRNGRFFYTNRLKKKASLKLLYDCLDQDDLMKLVKLNKKQIVNAISLCYTREQLHSIVYETTKIPMEKIKSTVIQEDYKIYKNGEVPDMEMEMLPLGGLPIPPLVELVPEQAEYADRYGRLPTDTGEDGEDEDPSLTNSHIAVAPAVPPPPVESRTPPNVPKNGDLEKTQNETQKVKNEPSKFFGPDAVKRAAEEAEATRKLRAEERSKQRFQQQMEEQKRAQEEAKRRAEEEALREKQQELADMREFCANHFRQLYQQELDANITEKGIRMIYDGIRSGKM
jgi:DNA polymerase III gamma/tau subunit